MLKHIKDTRPKLVQRLKCIDRLKRLDFVTEALGNDKAPNGEKLYSSAYQCPALDSNLGEVATFQTNLGIGLTFRQAKGKFYISLFMLNRQFDSAATALQKERLKPPCELGAFTFFLHWSCDPKVRFRRV